MKTKEQRRSAQAARTVRTFPHTEFTNEMGERFVIYTNGTTVFMEGDEVEMMVEASQTVDGLLPLFNKHFTIWSKEELYKLGLALIELTGEAEVFALPE